MLAQDQQTQLPSDAESARRRVIEDVIEEIRPNLKRDGGDCELVAIEGQKVIVRMVGACAFCKLSSTTMEGIQSRIIERLGEFVRLVPVIGGRPGH